MTKWDPHLCTAMTISVADFRRVPVHFSSTFEKANDSKGETHASPQMSFSVRDCETPHGCEADTGYHASTLQHIYDKYSWPHGTFRGILKQRAYKPHMRMVYFYCFFMLVHLDLNLDRKMEWSEVTSGRVQRIAKHGLSKNTIYDSVVPIGDALAMLIDEVDTNWRYDPYNHAPYFRTQYTAIVDTFPVYVTGSSTFANAQLIWGAKYERYIYKI